MPKKLGFTLIEVLIVISIIAILFMASITAYIKQRTKAEDAKAKSDVATLKIAFENYYNDNNCYPPADWFDGPEDCGSQNLRPYLSNIPCDKKTGEPYVYETDSTSCGSFKILVNLANESGAYCDSVGNTYTYGASSSNVTVLDGCPTPTPSPTATPTPTDTPTPTPNPSPTPTDTPSPTPTPTPSPSPTPTPTYMYYCASIGSCASYPTNIWNCIPNYASSTCDGACATTTGSCTRL